MHRRFPRFILVGALNTVFGYGVFYLTLAATGHPQLSLAIATALGALFNFRSTGCLVFGRSETRLIMRFLAVYAGLFILNAAALDGMSRTGLAPALAQAALLGPMAALSYLLNASLVFAGIDAARERKIISPTPGEPRESP